MPIFEVEHSGKRYQIEAPDQGAALNALGGLPKTQTPVQAAPTPDYSGIVAQQVNPVTDMVGGAASGLVRGIAETAMLPVTVPRMIQEKVFDPVTQAVIYAAENAVRSVAGMEKKPPSVQNPAVGNMFSMAQDRLRQGMDDTLYAPKTVKGEYAKTIGEFAPGALFGGGGVAARVLGNVVAPAVTSETLGQVARKVAPSYEGVARMGGALAGGLGAAAYNSRNVAHEVALRRSLDTLTPEELAAAEALQKNKYGVGVSLPNAVDAVTKGRTKITDLQRVVEGGGGANSLKQLFSKVPEQVDTAVSQQLDSIADPKVNTYLSDPYLLGRKGAELASGVIDDTIGRINSTTKEGFRAAEPTPIKVDGLEGEGLINEISKKVRGDATYNLPEKSYGTISELDIVRQKLRDAGDDSAQKGMKYEASRYHGAAKQLQDRMVDAAPDTYGTAMSTQAKMRGELLDPLEAGPVGQVSRSSTTDGVVDAIFPRTAHAGGEQVLGDAVRSLSAADPQITQALLRQGLADRYVNVSVPRSGDRYYTGASFAKEVAGFPGSQRELNLSSVLQAGAPNVADDVAGLIDVLRANGRRQPIGTTTAFNAQEMNDLSSGGLWARGGNAIASFGTSLPANAKDMAKRAWLGRNIDKLADLFADTQGGAASLRDILARSPERTWDEALRAALVTTPQQGRDRQREPR